ncbi:hypothetical protein CANCADRAFT_30816 [Tortispora caseinolytica NRRL Y-17796]|uniref:Serine/threonine-protein kinase ATG1 n=1 Tax=Tortispora caseinolytica NRRL Y-17796 TaxID=767744 RepID=A0A1E4TM81_9ASCO|nr:hypothetical protein CANCADRAFT_30816 [Tortispora caseinolytica NRRL Y-17796]
MSHQNTSSLPSTAEALRNYKILSEIGKGSFANVYKATDTRTNSVVAIKSAATGKLLEKLLQSLESEIQILKNVTHPHIVSLLDCQRSTGHIYIVTEYCSLGDLSFFIKHRNDIANISAMGSIFERYPSPQDSDGLNETLVKHFVQQLASALKFLRSKNLIHRDIKPQNLLLSPAKHTKSEFESMGFAGVYSLPLLQLADFGFARVLPSTSMAETLCGSPLYMAPEILRYEKYDSKVDLWSTGTVIYEMAVGKPPFRAANHIDLLRKIDTNNDKIKFRNTDVSPELASLIKGLLRRKPSDRMSFKEFFESEVVTTPINDSVDNSTFSILDSDTFITEQIAASRMKKSSNTTANSAGLDTQDNGISPYPVLSTELVGANNKAVNVPVNRTGSQYTTSLSDDVRNATAPTELHNSNSGISESSLSATPPGCMRLEQRRLTMPLTEERPKLVHLSRPSALEALQSKAYVGKQRSRFSSSITLNRPNFVSGRTSQNNGTSAPYMDRTDSGASSKGGSTASTSMVIERDYVVVEKRAVEVNALADQIANTPIHEGRLSPALRQTSSDRRRNSSESTRSLSIFNGSPNDRNGNWKLSYGAISPSALSKAITVVGARLFGKPDPVVRYRMSGNPRNPNAGNISSSVSPIKSASIANAGRPYPLQAADDPELSSMDPNDSKVLLSIEDAVIKAGVTYQFAEIKLLQLLPMTPEQIEQVENGAKMKQGDTGPGSNRFLDANEGKAPEDTLGPLMMRTLAEEALALYVKALSLLAKAMGIATEWWERTGTGGETAGMSSSNLFASSAQRTVARRMNVNIQWIRDHFNLALEKAEVARMKLAEAELKLSSRDSSDTMGNVSAESLLYERALEMSRLAAVNELVGKDISGCEIVYANSVWMLAAIMDSDNSSQSGNSDVFLMDEEDQVMVEKFIGSIKKRLKSLQRKLYQANTEQGLNVSPTR